MRKLMTLAAIATSAMLATAVEKTYRQDNVPDPILAIDYANPDSAAMIPYTAPTMSAPSIVSPAQVLF